MADDKQKGFNEKISRFNDSFEAFLEWRIVKCLQKVIRTIVGICLFLGFGGMLVFEFGENISDITNGGFVMVSILAGLSFAASSSVADPDTKKGYLYAGEILLIAALSFVFASVFRYLDIAGGDSFSVGWTSDVAWVFVNGMITFCFLIGVLSGLAGVIVIIFCVRTFMERFEWESTPADESPDDGSSAGSDSLEE